MGILYAYKGKYQIKNEQKKKIKWLNKNLLYTFNSLWHPLVTSQSFSPFVTVYTDTDTDLN